MNDCVTVNHHGPTQAQIEQAVTTALSRTLRLAPEQILPGSRLYEDLGLDSMALIHVNVSVEELLGAALSIGEAPEDDLHTVADLVDFAAQRLSPSKREAISC
jgi:acyl carrier protein